MMVNGKVQQQDLLFIEKNVQKYHSKVATTGKFSDSQQRVMLQNAVSPIPELRQVKVTAELQTALHGTTLSFDQYYTLLQSAATQYDTSSGQVSHKRTIYNSTVSSGDDTTNCNIEEQEYNIDTSIDTIQAHMSASKYPNSTSTRLPHERWKLLSNEERAAWNSLTKETKSVILGIINSNPSEHQRHSMIHQINNDTSDSTENNNDSSNNDSTSNILINATKMDVSPADTR